MGKEINRNNQKNAVLENVMQFLRDTYDTDVEKVSTSEAMMPAVDEDGNEFYFLIKISVPRGKRNGEGSYEEYNGYRAAEDYAEDMKAKAAEKQAAADKKKAEKKEKQRKKDAKKLVNELNKKGLKNLIHEEDAA